MAHNRLVPDDQFTEFVHELYDYFLKEAVSPRATPEDKNRGRVSITDVRYLAAKYLYDSPPTIEELRCCSYTLEHMSNHLNDLLEKRLEQMYDIVFDYCRDGETNESLGVIKEIIEECVTRVPIGYTDLLGLFERTSSRFDDPLDFFRTLTN